MIDRVLALALTAVLAVGCGASGASFDGASPGDASPEDAPAPFQAVSDLLAANCATCHDARDMDILPRYPKLSLTPADAYAALVSSPAHETCGGTLVVPGSSATSYLMRKLLDTVPCDGLHMPRSFEVIPATPLTAAELALVARWIDQGASP